MSYECKVITRETQKVMSVRTRCSVQELPDTIGKIYKNIYEYLMELKKEPSDAPFVGYFNMDMNDLDVEIGYPVSEAIKEKNNMKMSEIPSGKYATTFHKGSYSELPKAYESLMKWMEENGCIPMEIGYEVYLNDPSVVKKEDLETAIYLSIR